VSERVKLPALAALSGVNSTSHPSNLYAIKPDGSGLRQLTHSSIDGWVGPLMTGDGSTDNAAMGKVIFLMNVSLDGYIEAPNHSLDWTIDAGGTGRLAPHERRSGDDPRGAPARLQR
jgi:hypothetical protein